MSYQSEAELEKQLNLLNKDVLDGVELSDKEFERILTYLNGKQVYL